MTKPPVTHPLGLLEPAASAGGDVHSHPPGVNWPTDQDCGRKERHIPLARVTIAYRIVPHYRAQFYNALRLKLAHEGIRLRLLIGVPDRLEATKRDTVFLPWAEPMNRGQYRLPGVEMCFEWHEMLRATANEDLVIVEDAVRIVSNSALLVARRRGKGPRVALWGHGRDLQGSDGVAKEAIRAAQQRAADWYFGYTPSVVERVVANGVDQARVTCVMNTIDTEALQSHLDAVTEQDVAELLSSIGAINSSHVALYAGGLYEEKRIEFLLDAGQRIAKQLPEFRLIVAGGGPLSSILEERSRSHHSSWLRYLGPQFGGDLAILLKCARVLLMPGLVGLVIVDAFIAGCPIVTTADGRHSPEIDYLMDGRNGVMMPADTSAQEYADRVCRLMENADEVADLQAGALLSGAELTMSQMVDRFARGVKCALATV